MIISLLLMVTIGFIHLKLFVFFFYIGDFEYTLVNNSISFVYFHKVWLHHRACVCKRRQFAFFFFVVDFFYWKIKTYHQSKAIDTAFLLGEVFGTTLSFCTQHKWPIDANRPNSTSNWVAGGIFSIQIPHVDLMAPCRW